jgi:hypothetical protein
VAKFGVSCCCALCVVGQGRQKKGTRRGDKQDVYDAHVLTHQGAPSSSLFSLHLVLCQTTKQPNKKKSRFYQTPAKPSQIFFHEPLTVATFSSLATFSSSPVCMFVCVCVFVLFLCLCSESLGGGLMWFDSHPSSPYFRHCFWFLCVKCRQRLCLTCRAVFTPIPFCSFDTHKLSNTCIISGPLSRSQALLLSRARFYSLAVSITTQALQVSIAAAARPSSTKMFTMLIC